MSKTTIERVSILETKVDAMREDITVMRKENRDDHARVMEKLDNLRDLKNYVLGFLALAGIVLSMIAYNIDWHRLLENAIK
jgi:hypothetical protein